MKEFFAMGGYAFYVWSAFGLTTLVLFTNWILARRRYANAALRVRRRQVQHANKTGEVQS